MNWSFGLLLLNIKSLFIIVMNRLKMKEEH